MFLIYLSFKKYTNKKNHLVIFTGAICGREPCIKSPNECCT